MTRLPRYKKNRNRTRPDKSVLWTPRCPFCDRVFSPPEDIPLDGATVFGGRCACDAVYTCDPTGRNQGEAFMDALALAAGGYEQALQLGEGDYQEITLAYDIRGHRLIPRTYGYSFTKIARVIFIKLK